MPKRVPIQLKPQNVEKFIHRLHAKLNPRFIQGFEYISTEDARAKLERERHIEMRKGKLRSTPRAALDYHFRKGVKERWAEMKFPQQARLAFLFVRGVNPTGKNSMERVISDLYIYHEVVRTHLAQIESEMEGLPMRSTQYEMNLDSFFRYQNVIRALDAVIVGIRRKTINHRTGVMVAPEKDSPA